MRRIKPLNDYDTASIALTNYCQSKDITYNELAIGITNLHHILNEKGVKKNDRVLITNQNTPLWAMKLAAIVTYGAVAVTIPDQLSPTERAAIMTEAKVVTCLDDINNLDSLLHPTSLRPINIDIFSFSPEDDIIVDYHYDLFGILKAETTQVHQFMQLADDIKTRYNSLRHSRIPSMLLANQASIDAKEVLAALSIGAHITLAGTQPSSGTLLKCLKKYRPHFVYLDAHTAEQLIRDRVLPMLHSVNTPTYMVSSIARRNLMKQARKRMMFALGGCILTVCVTGGKFSPDIETFLQRIQFPYTIIGN